MNRHVILLLLLSLLLVHPLLICQGEETIAQDLPLTEDFVPPEITLEDIEQKPWLGVVKVAQEELGYVEGPRDNESKYGEWFCSRRVAWCAEFLTWCVDQSDQRWGTNLLYNVYPYYGKTSEGYPWFVTKGRFISSIGRLPTNEKQWLIGEEDYMQAGDYLPQAGDYLWLYYHTRKQGPEHVALVEGLSRNADGEIIIHVIEGNNPDRVARNTYKLSYSKIYGFGTPEKRCMSNLRLYQKGEDVTLLEKALEKLGYYDASNGYTTQVTSSLVQCIKKFNADFGLEGGRVADIQTWKKINELMQE